MPIRQPMGNLPMKAIDLMESGKYKADVQRSERSRYVLAKSAKDKLDGVRIVGAQPFAAFQAAIDGLLKTEVTLKK